MTWTRFNDMHSGGGTKVNGYEKIYIEAPIEAAKSVFYNRFERNPERVTCTCCGPDYTIDEYPSLQQATGHERNCRVLKTPKDELGRYMNDLPELKENYYLEPDEEPPEGFQVKSTPSWKSRREHVELSEFIQQDDVLVIRATEIDDSEKDENVPKEGYVWVDE